MSKLSKIEAKKRIEKLREVINHHRYLYHVKDKSEISDSAHDSLKHELYQLEQQFPDLITSDSPTQRVGSEPLDKFLKYKHKERMLSMEDVFSEFEFEAWLKRIEKIAGNQIDDFYCMTKIDGLAISLVYRDGILITAATRGDGRIGENVTQNVKTIEAIPLHLRIPKLHEIKKIKVSKKTQDKLKNLNGLIEVRGEIYVNKKDFALLNKKRKKIGEQIFANPRNIAAGSIRQLDSKIAAERPLNFRAWYLSDIGQDKHEKSMKILELLGFKSAPGKRTKSIKAVKKEFKSIEDERSKINFWIDGLVVRVNDRGLYKKLGIVGKAPRGLIAWKFPPEEATTRVLSVNWNVGRTGKITPVATVEPVFLAGTTVTHATLHNPDEIERLDLKIGDTVIITKAGDIIPKIRSVVKELRSGIEKDIKIPKKCPVCGDGVEKKDGIVDIICTNKDCRSMQKEKILHTARAFDIVGLGGQRIEHFISAGFLKSPADIFKLKESDIVQLDGYRDTSAKKIVAEIQSKKQISLGLFIKSLSIPNVGEETAFILAKEFKSIEKLAKASVEDLVLIKDIGLVVARSIKDYFGLQASKDLIDEYQKIGVKIIEPQKSGGKFSGKSFVITGALEKISRDEIKDKIRGFGGSVSTSVSKTTDFVIVGDNPGSKAKKADDFNIKTLSEQEFLTML